MKIDWYIVKFIILFIFTLISAVPVFRLIVLHLGIENFFYQSLVTFSMGFVLGQFLAEIFVEHLKLKDLESTIKLAVYSFIESYIKSHKDDAKTS